MALGNCLGRYFRVMTFGESHGRAVGVVVDGVRPGMALDGKDIQRDLDRRRPGRSAISSARREEDRVEILSGVLDGKTLGTPICMVVWNRDQRSGDYETLRDLFRPGHADFTYAKKYGIRDHRGGGRASARETVGRVAAGAIAKKELEILGIRIRCGTVAVGGIRTDLRDWEQVELNPVRCPDAEAAVYMEDRILRARAEGDSVGGIVEVEAEGVPPGWGDPVFDKLDALLAHALMSIGAVKGVEIGEGFRAAALLGSEMNDPLDPDGWASNRAGGILGGISNGSPIVARVAVKPTPSIGKEQVTVDTQGVRSRIRVQGRHDPCICPRIVPVVEAMTALVLYDAWLSQERVKEDSPALEILRREVDGIDREMLELLASRERLSRTIGEIKKKEGLAVLDNGREESMAERRKALARELGLGVEHVETLFRCIMERSRAVQDL